MTRNALLVAALGGALLMGCSPVQDLFSKAGRRALRGQPQHRQPGPSRRPAI
jgi:hypothetical protein